MILKQNYFYILILIDYINTFYIVFLLDTIYLYKNQIFMCVDTLIDLRIINENE